MLNLFFWMWHCSLLNVGGKLVLQASINNPNQTRKTSHGRRQQGDNVGMQTCMWSIDCGDVTWSNWNDITGLLRAKVFSNSGLHTYFFPLQLFYSLYFICLHRKGSKVFYCWKVFFSFFFLHKFIFLPNRFVKVFCLTTLTLQAKMFSTPLK